MTTNTASRPTGRRKLTRLQFQAELAAHAVVARPPATTPGRALATFKRAEPALGVSAQIVKFVDYLVGCTREVDWDGTGLGPIAWPSDFELEDRLGVGRTRCKQIVRATLDGGYVRLRRSANGKRYGVRTDGRITQAFGFDLSPLVERMDEFAAATAEWEARRAEGKRLRREIGSVRGSIRSMVDLAVMENVGTHDWGAFATQADALFEQRGRLRDPLSLVPILARLRAIEVRVRDLGSVRTVGVDHGNYGPSGSQNRPHITTTKYPKIVETITSIAEANGQEGKSSRPTPPVTDRKPVDASCPLRGFVTTPSFVVAIAPPFASATQGMQLTWSSLADVAPDVCAELGVSQHAWRQACVVLGRQAAIVVLATIAARYGQHLIRSPGGLLRRMVELHREGTLRLDLTLFGLAAKLKPGLPSRPAAALPSSSCSTASDARCVASTPVAGPNARSSSYPGHAEHSDGR